MALPLRKRVALAEALWQSNENGPARSLEAERREALALARRRDRELTSGQVKPRSHEQVMRAARRAIGCA